MNEIMCNQSVCQISSSEFWSIQLLTVDCWQFYTFNLWKFETMYFFRTIKKFKLMWTLDVKIQLRSVFLILFRVAAPFLSCRTLRRHPWVLVLKLAAPLELLTAPWLRTTGLDNKMLIKFLFNNFSWCLKWSKTHSPNVHPIPDPGAGEGVSLQPIPHPTTENRNCSSGLYFIQLVV